MQFEKYGSSSIVLSEGIYGKYFPVKKNKLIKITKISDKHNEFKNISFIKKITNYEKYYCLPDETIEILKSSDELYNIIKNDIDNTFLFINNQNLQYFYIENGGYKDLHDTIDELFDKKFHIWNSYKSIYIFVCKILTAINYLHNNKICHLDLKMTLLINSQENYKVLLLV